MRTVVLVIFIILPLIVSAVGKDFLNQRPPELRVKEWLNTEKGYKLSELRGKAVLIDFWATWCPPCRRAMPHLQKLYKEYSEKGLIVIALSAETRDRVEPFIKQNNYTFPVALDDSRKTNQLYGIRSIPTTYLIGPTGRVVWQGHPLDKKLESAVEEVMKDVGEFAPDRLLALKFGLTITKKLSKRLGTASRYIGNGRFKSALKAAAKVLESEKASDEDKKDAAYLIERIELHGEKLLAKSRLLLDRKQFLGAERLLKKVEKAFYGTDIAKRAKKELSRMHTDKVISRELKAAKALESAIKGLNNADEDEVRRKLERLIADYPDTEAAKAAEEKLKELAGPKGESGASPKKP